MENQFNYGLRLSLEEMALRRVAVNVWIGSDTVAALKSGTSWDWDDHEHAVKYKVSELILPKLLKNRIMPLIKYIGTDILNWQTFHGRNFSLLHDEVCISKLHWTCTGTIDYLKTAKELVSLEILDVITRYKLACLYCLEDDIRILWEELPDEYKNSFSDDVDLISAKTSSESYWAFILNGKEVESSVYVMQSIHPLSFRLFSFKMSLLQGNKAAVDYFYQKLTNEERVLSLEFAVDSFMEERFRETGRYPEPNRSSADHMYERDRSAFHLNFPRQTQSAVLFHLLSLMTPEQRTKVLEKYPSEILVCCLDCQLEDHLLEMADQIWTYVHKNRYGFVVAFMLENMSNANHYFPSFIQKFFLRSPVDFINYFFYQECKTFYSRMIFRAYFHNQPCELVSLLRLIFNEEDFETLRVIFRNMSPPHRTELFFHRRVFGHLEDLVLEGSWKMVEVCLQEAMFSQEQKESIKETYTAFQSETDRADKVISQKWERFFRILDETGMSASNKRSSEDQNHTKPKKLCKEKENVL